MNVLAHLQEAHSNRLQVAQHARNFLCLSTAPPFSAQARAQPIGQKAQTHMVDHAVRPPVVDGPNLQVALEFAESFFEVQQPFVMPSTCSPEHFWVGSLVCNKYHPSCWASCVIKSALRSHCERPRAST